jgi:hypothetical protein
MKKTFEKVSIFAIVLVALLIIPLFASCAANKGEYVADDEMMNSAPEKDYSEGGVSYAPDGSITSDNMVNTNRKIIRTFTVYGETKEYDAAISAVNSSIATYGGYVSESRVTGPSYSYSGRGYSREAYFVIKIPAENLDAFISQIGGSLNVTTSSSTQQDVSEAYYSIEARMKTLETERESLLAMMASIDTAKDYDFWYTLQKKISETEQQIAEYQAILKSYDGQVAYSTVNLTVYEVVEYTPVQNEAPTFGERIAEAFVDSWTDFGEGCMDFAVFMVSAIPTLLIFPGIPAVIVIIVIAVHKKNKKKKEEKEEKE